MMTPRAHWWIHTTISLLLFAIISGVGGFHSSESEACEVGPLTEAQGKRMVISAIKIGREIQKQVGVPQKRKGTPVDQLVKQSGVVAIFKRGEHVSRGPDGKPCVVVSVSRAKGLVGVAQEDAPDSVEYVEPGELFKDHAGDAWPSELTNL